MRANFDASALKIIQDSVVSSLYIDDKIVEPFEEVDSSDEYFKISSGLYNSFKKENKSIDFYKFNVAKSWKDDKDYLFRNRDMLVLDWQLDDSKQMNQTDTLEIIHEAVKSNNTHFISIYTATPEKDLVDIFYLIKSFFSKGFNKDSYEKYSSLTEKIEDEGIDSSFLKNLGGRFKELALYDSERSRIYGEIKSIISGELGDNYKIFARSLRDFHADGDQACEILGYCINGLEQSKVEEDMLIKSAYIGDKFIVINHTIIHISNKHDPEPSELFQFFTDAVLKVYGNLLTLMSLEIRTLIRESSGFIGKDIDSINEAAFFFHREKKSQSFYDFIIEIWKGQTTSFVYEKYKTITTLQPEFWETYSDLSKMSNKIDDLKKNKKEFEKSLAELNYYYNVLNVNRAEGDAIKFGDVFVEDGKSGAYNNLFLCITAHCDCAQPENIYNNFYFLKGEKVSTEKALGEGDGTFCSFLKDSNGEPIAVRWGNKPIVININDPKIIHKLFDIKIGSNEHSVKYLCTLKENYTQRMANNSFSFAMRVGIDFASYQ
jgi:hypothetical protein